MNTLSKKTGLQPAQWFVMLLAAISIVVATPDAAAGKSFTIHRTNLKAERVDVAVSPDGRRLIYDVHQLSQPLRIVDLESGESQVIPGEAGRLFESPSWSPDGRFVVVTSTGLRKERYAVDDMQIRILETQSWHGQTLTSGEGVRHFPIFAADGKTIYYFKGIKRESGKTPASRYDLHSLPVAGGKELKLTDERFYQAGTDDDNGTDILFSGVPSRFSHFANLKDVFGGKSLLLFKFNKETKELMHFPVEQTSTGIFQFSDSKRDQAGNLYFVASKEPPLKSGSSRYLWYLVRANPDGTAPQLLKQLPISMGFDIVRQTGEIYVADKEGEFIVIRKIETGIALQSK